MGRNRERADAVARELAGLALPADVLRRPRGGQGAAARALGRVDILVNAAGGTSFVTGTVVPVDGSSSASSVV